MSRPGAPDFCIIGAPKCGTTALYSYLREHPGIFMPPAKEPYYYCTDFPKWRRIKTKRAYERLFEKENLFKSVGPDRVRGEASVWYLYSQVAIPKLLADYPDVKMIVMVRNPLDMAPSIHSQMAFTLHEDQHDFWDAWSLQDDRRQGRSLPMHSREPQLLMYKDVCRLGTQVERLMQLARPEQLKIIVFDDFAADTQAVYEDVLDFIGVKQDGRNDFPRVNENKSLRSSALANSLWPILPIVRPVEWAIRRTIYAFGVEPNLWKNMNADPQKRPPLTSQQLAELIHAFSDDVQHLSDLLQRDLTHWLNEDIED